MCRRAEQAGVGRLVPRPYPTLPTPAPVDLRQRLAEREDTVKPGQVEGAQGFRIAHRPVVRVVEKQGETGAALAQLADGGD